MNKLRLTIDSYKKMYGIIEDTEINSARCMAQCTGCMCNCRCSCNIPSTTNKVVFTNISSDALSMMYGNIGKESNVAAKCACVKCNSCTCGCSCRNRPDEIIDWKAL